MTAVIQHRYISISRHSRKPDCGVVHPVIVEISRKNRLKPNLLDSGGNVCGVTSRASACAR
jgi:hypothetical protein